MSGAQIIPFQAMSTLPNRIRELRKAAGLTLQELGAKCGTSHSQISSLELGDRQLTQTWMRVLAAALECDPADLLPATDSHKSLTLDEMELLEHYRNAPAEGQRAINRVAESLSTYTPEPLDFNRKAQSG